MSALKVQGPEFKPQYLKKKKKKKRHLKLSKKTWFKNWQKALSLHPAAMM
jgi:hypothetical protein